jgi:hypothetical protein
MDTALQLAAFLPGLLACGYVYRTRKQNRARIQALEAATAQAIMPGESDKECRILRLSLVDGDLRKQLGTLTEAEFTHLRATVQTAYIHDR